MNVPLGIFALIASAYLLENFTANVGKFDVVGFLLTGIGFASFMAGIELFAGHSTSTLLGAVVTVFGLLLLLTAVFHIRRADKPLFSFEAMQFRTFRLSMYGGSVVRIALGSAPFLVPLMLQLGMGYSPVEAGTLLLWLFVGNIAIKPATTWIMNTFGFKRVLIANGIMISLGFVALSLITQQSSSVVIAVILFVSGVNRSMHLTLLNTIAFADVPKDKMRDANTLGAILMQMNRGMGITISALMLAVASLMVGNSSSDPSLINFKIAMAMMAVVALLSITDSLMLSKTDGDSVLKKAT